ncbi:MAG: nucleotidyl transferase AbiEii/AbiGii toxin family protein [Acidimicrobiales bacterium]
MIPRADIVDWGRRVGWPTDEQVEQDLLLSRLIIEIANDPYLGEELVFRGGTCLYKLHADKAYRYSEDLDYVRRSGGGIADLTRAVSAIGSALGMEVRTRIGQQPKIYLRAPFESGDARMRIKVEVNTFERSPARELVRLPYSVKSAWFTGRADVLTFSLAELVSTKLRALFQRSKGRDLFDLWLALSQLGIAPMDIVACFDAYRPRGYTRGRAEQNLRAKLANRTFREDVMPLVATWPEGYDIAAAADLVITEVFSLL